MDSHRSFETYSRLLGALSDVVSDWGHPVWFVGGTVRDRELGHVSPDIDVVTAGDAADLAARVARRAGLPWFPLSHEFGAYRVVGEPEPTGMGRGTVGAEGVTSAGSRDVHHAEVGRTGGGGHLDVVALRGGSLEDDLALRDFTVNAMALSVSGGPVIDPFDGRLHLRERRLVPVSRTIFADDPLRLLRAARFAHVMDLAIGPDLRALARAEAGRLASAAAERILNEVVLTLEVGRSAAAVRLWDDLGLLEVFLPEIEALRGVSQSPFHHHDVYGHTLETMERLDEIVAAPGRWFGLSWELLEARLAQPVDGMMSRPVALRLGALLHDVAKPETRAVGEGGRVLFWGHTEIGGPVAEEVCARLRCSAAAAGLIRATVERHLDIGFLQHERPVSPREVVRFLWRAEPWEPEVIIVSVADRLATRGPQTQDASIDAHLDTARGLMDAWRARREKGIPPLPLDGEVLMAELGLEAGPLLGRVLREVRLGWEAEELEGRAEAVAFARDRLDALRADEQAL